MKTIIIALLLSISFALHSQGVLENFTQKLTIELDGYIEEEKTDEDNYKSIAIHIPSYYDFDMTRTVLTRLVNRYSNIEMTEAWKVETKYHDFPFYRCSITIDDKEVQISYGIINKETQIVIVLYKVNTDKYY